MKKKIKSIYEYRDYRALLNEDLAARMKDNPSYSLRAYSRDLELSAGFLSDLLKGKKDLSLRTALEVFAKLGFEGDEIEYVRHLVLYQIASDEDLRRHNLNILSEKYGFTGTEDNKRDLVIKSPEHLMVHGIVSVVSDEARIHSITDQLGIQRDRVAQILKEFIEAGYAEVRDGGYYLMSRNLWLPGHERLVRFQNEFSNRKYEAVVKNDWLNPRHTTAHGIVLGFDSETYALAEEALRRFLQTLCRLSEQSENVDRFMFYSDSVVTVFSPQEEASSETRSSRCLPT